MAIPEDVVEYLKDMDEITLLERLEISSTELIDRFTDKIEERIEEFEYEIQALRSYDLDEQLNFDEDLDFDE